SKAKTAIVAAVVVLTTAGVTPYVWYYHLAPNAWQNRFHATYHLRNGELLRYIAPPYIPERMTFYKTDNPSQYQAIPTGPNLILFSQDNEGKLSAPQFTFGPKQFPLYLVIQIGFHLKRYEFQGPNNLLNLTVNGDWIINENLTNRETLFAQMEPILFKATKHHIVFTKQTVEQDVIVVHGDHFTVPPDGKIHLYAEKSTDTGYNDYGNLTNLLDAVGKHLNIRTINETQIKPDAPEIQTLNWIDHRDADTGYVRARRAELTDKFLKNLSDQTGLTFTREKRPDDVWVISEQK
ncbi:MAG TPA: hypothetical protein VN516_04720, partial [Candidatus Baltobacteraceae bacterium]|nr:hypothetical protein [Candidatus Baltobacteraceae bacterium]